MEIVEIGIGKEGDSGDCGQAIVDYGILVGGPLFSTWQKDGLG